MERNFLITGNIEKKLNAHSAIKEICPTKPCQLRRIKLFAKNKMLLNNKNFKSKIIKKILTVMISWS